MPGVIGSVLGLVGPVSVYCDWVICDFSLSVAGHKNGLSRDGPCHCDTLCMLLGYLATNRQQ